MSAALQEVQAQRMTPSEMESCMRRRCPIAVEVDALYRAREAYLQELQERGEVTLDDVRNLDRLGRCKVASEFFALCTTDAAEALLNDPHHSVRSCAALSAAKPVCQLY